MAVASSRRAPSSVGDAVATVAAGAAPWVGPAGEPEGITVATAVGVAGLVCAGEPAVGAAPSAPQPGSADNARTAASIAAERILLSTAWVMTLKTYHSTAFQANGKSGATATRGFGIIRKLGVPRPSHGVE